MRLTNLNKDLETGNIQFQMEITPDEHTFLLFVALSNLIRLGAVKQAELEEAVKDQKDVTIDLGTIPTEAFYNAS